MQNKGKFRPQRRQFDKPKRAPMPEGFSLFYVAVSCPGEVNDKIEVLKEYMQEKYGCKAARKSPAHLTIVPPFRAEDELQVQLSDFVTTFNMGIVPFDVRLKGYGQFADRVLFVDIEAPNEKLIELEKECMQEFTDKFPGIIFGMKPEFSPHITIATRDIPEGTIQESRAYFEANHPIDETYEATTLALYRLENGWWKKID